MLVPRCAFVSVCVPPNTLCIACTFCRWYHQRTMGKLFPEQVASSSRFHRVLLQPVNAPGIFGARPREGEARREGGVLPVRAARGGGVEGCGGLRLLERNPGAGGRPQRERLEPLVAFFI